MDRTPGPELELFLDNLAPISSADLGEFLKKLGADYKKVSGGRTLAVAELRTGTLTISVVDAVAMTAPYLKDAVEIAKGGKALVDFAKALKGVFTKGKAEGVGPSQQEGLADVLQSAEALAKVAADSGSELKISQKDRGGKEWSISLTPPEVFELKQRILAERQIRKQIRRAAPRLSYAAASEIDYQPKLAKTDSGWIEESANKLLTSPDNEAEQSIRVLVASLRTIEMMPIADILHERLMVAGRVHLANVLANELRAAKANT